MKKERESGIELLKIIAIVLIIVNHVAQTATSPASEIRELSHFIFPDVNAATTNIQYLIAAILRYWGPLGNAIFFICSAWFLCDSTRVQSKKVLQIILNVWVINIIFLVIFLLLGETISMKNVVFSVLPNTFGTNWYITCYLLFYLIHPFLNWIIDRMTQKQLLLTNSIACFLYLGIGFVKENLLYSTNLVIFIVIYFLVAYMKRYMPNVVENTKWNVWILIVGTTLFLGLIVLTNYIGLHVDFFGNLNLHWATNQNPFLILTACALFNLFRKVKIINRRINFLAGCSLLIYIIHENILLRTYLRPRIFAYIYSTYGDSHLLLWILGISILVLLLSTVASILYRYTLEKVVTTGVEKLYTKCKSLSTFQ